MTHHPDIQFILDLLRLLGKEEICDLVFWIVDEEDNLQFFLGCNDVFGWASADAEEITSENLPQLRQAIIDIKAIDEHAPIWDACQLFVARIRGMRPQGAAYPKEKELWPLFDACGPEREVGFRNPYKPGEK